MTIEDINKRIAEKLGLTIKLVTEINRFQYQFLLDTIKEGNDNVHLIYIGKFVKKAPRKPYTKNNGI